MTDPITVQTFDWSIFFTVIGTGISVIGLVYAIMKDFKNDIGKRLDLQDERIFLLATGKTLQQAMVEAKMNSDSRVKK